MKPERLRRSQKQERRIARLNGGRVQAQSGAGPFRKEDVRLDGWLVQNKSAKGKSFILKRADLDIVEQNAALDGCLPAMQVDIEGQPYWVMPAWVVTQELGLYA